MEDRFYYEYSELILKKRWKGNMSAKRATKLMKILNSWW